MNEELIKEEELKPKHKKNNELLEAKEKIKNLEEEVLKAKADLINYRKRKDEEVSNLLKYSNSDILLSILPILDNFERAISLDDNLNEESKKFLSGFKMIYASLKQILDYNEVKEMDVLGTEFDSKIHNCIYTESNKDFKDGEVLEVLLKGYTYYDKVLRCASVKVNKIEKNKENERNDINE